MPDYVDMCSWERKSASPPGERGTHYVAGCVTAASPLCRTLVGTILQTRLRGRQPAKVMRCRCLASSPRVRSPAPLRPQPNPAPGTRRVRYSLIKQISGWCWCSFSGLRGKAFCTKSDGSHRKQQFSLSKRTCG